MSALRTADGLRQIVAIHVRDASNALRSVAAGRARNASNALRTFFSAMAATASPAAVTGYGNSSSAVDIQTGEATVTVAGGSGGETYAWGAQAGWTVLSPTSATTRFQANGIIAGDFAEQDFSCVVTDSAGAMATTNSVHATATNINAS